MKYGIYNGAWVLKDQLRIPVTDLSIHRGYGVFDYLRMQNGHNPWIDWYIKRFLSSATAAHLSLDVSGDQLKELIQELVAKNGDPDCGVKLLATAGDSVNGFTPSGPPRWMILTYRFVPVPEEIYQSGAKLISHKYQRALPQIKSINYFLSAVLSEAVKSARAIDVLYFHPEAVYETSRCNIFIVEDHAVHTPAEGILQGVTRKRVLSLESPPVPIKESIVTRDQLDRADEIFITSTTKGILPVVEIDGRPVGDGKPGKVTISLREMLRSF